MESDWILGVISDLRTFAEMNGMSDLAAKLVETADVAASEIHRSNAEDTTRGWERYATCAAGYT